MNHATEHSPRPEVISWWRFETEAHIDHQFATLGALAHSIAIRCLKIGEPESKRLFAMPKFLVRQP